MPLRKKNRTLHKAIKSTSHPRQQRRTIVRIAPQVIGYDGIVSIPACSSARVNSVGGIVHVSSRGQ